MGRPVTLREFLLRYSDHTISKGDREALRHEREFDPQESPLPFLLGMDVTDGEIPPEVQVPPSNAPTQTPAEEDDPSPAGSLQCIDEEC